jgi:protein CpxP
MTDPITSRPATARKKWVLGAVMATAFLAGGLTVSGLAAFADDAGAHGMMAGGDGHGHMEAMAHMTAALTAVGATADQKARIGTILHAGLKPIMDVHHGMGELHGSLLKLLTASTIDRGALEQMRAAQIAELDQASRTATQALADAAEVLTPDQRAKLAGMIAEHHRAM